jgi:hypothetical protein
MHLIHREIYFDLMHLNFPTICEVDIRDDTSFTTYKFNNLICQLFKAIKTKQKFKNFFFIILVIIIIKKVIL